MRRTPTAPLAAALLLLLAAAPLGCGGDDDNGTGPGTGACSIDIYTPTDGEHFYSLDDMNIRWHASGGGQVSILLLKAGAVVDTLAAGTANDGFFYWSADTRGATSGDDFALRVASTSSEACADTVGISLTNTVGCVLALTVDPDSTLTAGQDYLVTWTSENSGGRVDLELWKGSLEEELVGIIAVDVPDNGSYLWQDVDSFNKGTALDYHLRIADRLVDGCEDMVGPFRLVDPEICYIDVMTPVDNQQLTVGQQVTISFDPVNASGTVNIRLYALGTLVPGGYIADGVPAAGGTFQWTVTDYGYTGANNVYRIVIIDAADPYCVGRSETFTILQP